MKHSILMPLKDLKDSVSSHAVVDYMADLPLCPDELTITLLHIFRRPSASEALMGADFVREEPIRLKAVLEEARDRLVEGGFRPDNIAIELVDTPYPTITDGIIDQFNKGAFDLVVIGRKKKSKSEEFVLGDISVKLVRALESTAVLVVKSE